MPMAALPWQPHTLAGIQRCLRPRAITPRMCVLCLEAPHHATSYIYNAAPFARLCRLTSTSHQAPRIPDTRTQQHHCTPTKRLARIASPHTPPPRTPNHHQTTLPPCPWPAQRNLHARRQSQPGVPAWGRASRWRPGWGSLANVAQRDVGPISSGGLSTATHAHRRSPPQAASRHFGPSAARRRRVSVVYSKWDLLALLAPGRRQRAPAAARMPRRTCR